MLPFPPYGGSPSRRALVIIYTQRAEFCTFRTICANASSEDRTRAGAMFSRSRSQNRRGITGIPVNGYTRLAHHCGVWRRRPCEANRPGEIEQRYNVALNCGSCWYRCAAPRGKARGTSASTPARTQRKAYYCKCSNE